VNVKNEPMLTNMRFASQDVLLRNGPVTQSVKKLPSSKHSNNSSKTPKPSLQIKTPKSIIILAADQIFKT
jgi:hypothetical protein